MLINRRQALISLGVAWCRGVMWSLPRPVRPAPWEETPLRSDRFETPPESAVDMRLREDLARLAPRIYSEEGIPVFLACMNMVPARTLHKPAKVTLPPLSAALASAFHRNAEAFQRIRPDAKAQDVAPLIEVLADRDFSNGRGEEAL